MEETLNGTSKGSSIESTVSGTPKLSICISTVNRANFIGQTLDKIVCQLTDSCEILVLDNASTDDTPQIVTEYSRRVPSIRYVRREVNQGLDRNFDAAVECAKGEYCWLLPDDDYLKPGAINAALAALARDPSVVFVNFEFRNTSMSEIMQDRCLPYEADRLYGPWELGRLFFELGDYLRYIGGIVIRRSVWLERDRNLYVGSLFSFVGIIFQRRLPGPAYVIAEPYVSYRLGNSHSWSTNGMELMFCKWPSLVESLPISDSAKKKVHSAEPWKHAFELLVRRGAGHYNLEEYRRWMRPQLSSVLSRFFPFLAAVLPGPLANAIMLIWLSKHLGTRTHRLQSMYRSMLKGSRFYYKNWRSHEGKRRPAKSPPPRSERLSQSRSDT